MGNRRPSQLVQDPIGNRLNYEIISAAFPYNLLTIFCESSKKALDKF